MRDTIRRTISILTALLLALAALPCTAFGGRGEHDVSMLRAFFEQAGNGAAMNGSGYDPDDPSTWSSVVWSSDGRLLSISANDLGDRVTGTLDLSGCGSLETVSITDCRLTGAVLSGCGALRQLNLTGNALVSLSVVSCGSLELLWVGSNELGSLDVSDCAALTSLNCSYNRLSSLDVSFNPELTVLRCGNNELVRLDVSACRRLDELSVKSNRIASLDLDGLTELTKLYCFNNPITRLDVSVMNGGESFVIEASAGGFVGTKCVQGSGGITTVASARPADGFGFTGWFEGDEPVSGSPDIACVFGEGPRRLTARFASDTPGDADGDGEVTISDALLVLRYSLGLISGGLPDSARADVTGDGEINIQDALLILRIALGLASR